MSSLLTTVEALQFKIVDVTQIVSLGGSSSQSEAFDNDSVSLVQTLKIVMQKQKFFSPVVGSK